MAAIAYRLRFMTETQLLFSGKLQSSLRGQFTRIQAPKEPPCRKELFYQEYTVVGELSVSEHMVCMCAFMHACRYVGMRVFKKLHYTVHISSWKQ